MLDSRTRDTKTITDTSGFPLIISNCSSMPSPPTIKPHRRVSPEPDLELSSSSSCPSPAWGAASLFQPLTRLLPTLTTWRASSLAGTRMIARTPKAWAWRPPRRCTRGIMYARVFPEPVRAMPTRSRGGAARSEGMAARWIGVGVRYPCRVSARSRNGWRPGRV